MLEFLEAVTRYPWFFPFVGVVAFYPFFSSFIRKVLRHHRKHVVEARARATDCTMHEIERLETENKKLHTRIGELEHQLGSGGPYRSRAFHRNECDCPCTGMCGEGFGLGPDAPEPLSLQRGPDGVAFAGLGYVGPDFAPRPPGKPKKPEHSFARAEIRREMERSTGTFVSVNRADLSFLLKCPSCDRGDCDRCVKERPASMTRPSGLMT